MGEWVGGREGGKVRVGEWVGGKVRVGEWVGGREGGG